MLAVRPQFDLTEYLIPAVIGRCRTFPLNAPAERFATIPDFVTAAQFTSNFTVNQLGSPLSFSPGNGYQVGRTLAPLRRVMARTSKQYKHSWAAHPVVVWSETLACGHVKSHIQIDRVEKFSAHRRCTNCLAITLALPPKKPVQSVKLADLEIFPKKEGIL